MPYYLK
jgi:hypothetical protein